VFSGPLNSCDFHLALTEQLVTRIILLAVADHWAFVSASEGHVHCRCCTAFTK